MRPGRVAVFAAVAAVAIVLLVGLVAQAAGVRVRWPIAVLTALVVGASLSLSLLRPRTTFAVDEEE